ncbi:MAG: autotransporter-associated beta strand repeat-containing protein [Bacteroidetes bacterium]|nr:autotransporter-associated beta strand repeat-containing protein [Bacteroidota bacterium]
MLRIDSVSAESGNFRCLSGKGMMTITNVIMMSILFSSINCFSQNQWDGDNPSGNFSYKENWYGDAVPGTWNSTTNLQFELRNNASQLTLYYDFNWRDVQSIIFQAAYGQTTPLNGNGNGLNFWYKVENNSFYSQNINIPLSMKGIAGELNAVHADLTIGNVIFNDGNAGVNVYNSNNKSLILSNYLVGNGNVKLTMKNGGYGIVQINANMPALSSSSFSGGIDINRGELWFNAGAAINSGTLKVGNGDGNVCKLYINDADGGTTVTNTINIPSSSTNSYVGALNSSNTNTFSGPITGSSNLNLEEINSGGTIEFAGIISLSGSLNVSGSGTVKLSASNSYTGVTTISSGILKLGASGVVPDASAVTVTSTLDFSGFSETVGSIAGAGLITSSAAGNPILTAGGDNSNTAYSGIMQNGSATTVGLTKTGTGILTLSGANTYTGATTITGGTLRLGAADRIANTSNVVLNGGTLSTGATTGYSETVGTLSLSDNSTIALGTGLHTLTFAASNGLSWVSGKTITITGWTGGGGATGTAGKIFVGGSNTGLISGQLAQISFTGYTGTATILSSGEIVPSISFSAGTLTSFNNVCTNTTTSPNSFTISGTNLSTANVTVGALSGFTYSTISGGTYTTSLSLTQPGGSYSQTIFVKFSPTAVQSYSGNIAVGGGGATSVNVAATGSGINTPPTVTTPTSASVAAITATLGGDMTVVGCNNATEQGIFYSTTNGFADGEGTKVSTTGLNVSSTGTFTQAVSLLTASTVYYFKAFATSTSGTAYSTQGTFTTTWEYNTTGSIWATATQAPGSGNSVTIQATHAVTVDAALATPATCAALTIEATALLTINSAKALTVSGALINSAGNTGLVVESGGSLKTNGTVSGGATVKRDITSNNAWHFLSSPVTTQNICNGRFAPLATHFAADSGATFDFYKWSETTVITGLPWINLKKSDWSLNITDFGGETPQFATKTGYLVAYSGTFAGSSTKSFAGTLNTGDQTFTLTKDGNTWNLIGNPFPSAIDWANGSIIKTGLANGYYYIYNASGSEADKYEYYLDAGHKTAGTNGKIAAMQGFFVKASGTSLFVPNSARVHDGTWLKNSETTAQNHLTLTLGNGARSDEAYVIFESVGSITKGWYDADKMFSMNTDVPQVYTLKDNDQKICINSMPLFNNPVAVPVGMIIPADGSYTLQLSGLETFPTLPGILLEDLKTNTTQNMIQTPVYAFTASTTDDQKRFLLHFSGSNGISEKPGDHSFQVFSSGSALFVTDNTGKNQGNVYVYNMMGQLIASSALNGISSCKLILNMPVGYYIVKVVSNDHAFSSKVFINN